MEDKEKPVRQVDILKKTLSSDSVKEQFKNALGENSNAFIASLIDIYTGDPALKTCDPNAVVAQALKAAVLKLPIVKSLGYGYIVVFNNSVKTDTGWVKVPTPTFILGYKGYIQLAYRTNQYKNLNVDVVYEGELRKIDKLTGEFDVNGEKISDKIVGYFAYFKFTNGLSKCLYMDLDSMCKFAKRYSPTIKSKNEVTVETLKSLANSEQYGGQVGWLGNFTDQAMKTCLRKLLSRWGALSIDVASIVDSQKKYEEDDDIDNNNDSPIKHIDIQNAEFTEVKDSKPTETASQSASTTQTTIVANQAPIEDIPY